jgi:hypothetical protein
MMIAAAADYRRLPLKNMLDQYGLAYICQNPLVLFGDVATRPEDAAYAMHGGRPSRSADGVGRECERRGSEGLWRRVREAHEILNQLYAPWPAQYMRPQGPTRTHAAYRP